MNLKDIEPLLNANRILASTLDIDRLLKVVLELAAQVVGAETGSLLLLDQKTNELVFDIALGEAGRELKTIRLKMGEGIAGWVAQEGRPLIVNDPKTDPRWTRRGDEKTKFVTRSILCVPMVYQGNLMGVVQAINRKDPNGFSEEDRMLLEAFAAQTAVAIQNARLFSSLRQEKEKVETIFAQMAEGAVLSDEEGRFLAANPAARALLGVQEDGQSPENIWELLSNFQTVPAIPSLRSEKASESAFEASRAEGKTLILSGLVKLIQSDKGELIGHLTVFRDVTAEKKEERLKRDFLSLMSHKLKTPLVAITGYTPMILEDEAIMGASPFTKKGLQAIHTQGLHLKGLVEKLISFSMVEAEQMTLDLKPCSLKALAEESVAAMETFLAEKKARVALDSSLDSARPVNVDAEKFKEAIKGLVENAAKFNSKEEKMITLSSAERGNETSLIVEDDGVGIPSEELDKIFQKFYQVEESFTGQVEGAGLGLALVKRLVESHGGKVRVESKIGAGSQFTITLPASG